MDGLEFCRLSFVCCLEVDRSIVDISVNAPSYSIVEEEFAEEDLTERVAEDDADFGNDPSDNNVAENAAVDGSKADPVFGAKTNSGERRG